MPYKCVVPKCKGNYKTGPKVSVFRFPTSNELLKKWKSAIPRDFVVTNHSRVSILYFQCYLIFLFELSLKKSFRNSTREHVDFIG